MDWSGPAQENDKAIADFGEVIRLDPHRANAYFLRGIAWFRKGEYDRAIADLTEAIRIDPHDAHAYSNRGFAWIFKHENDKAIADFNEAIKINPRDADTYASLALTHPDKAKALEFATRACELANWTNPKCLEALAFTHAELGDFESAVKWQKKANQLQTKPQQRALGEEILKLYQENKSVPPEKARSVLSDTSLAMRHIGSRRRAAWLRRGP